MKRLSLLISFAALLPILLGAQTSQSDIVNVKMKPRAYYGGNYVNPDPAPFEQTHVYKKAMLDQQNAGTNSGNSRVINTVALGSAGNLFTIIGGGTNCLAADDDLNSVVFIHRADPSQFPNTNVGQYMFDYSTDGGATFSNNNGVVNPSGNQITLAGRYPQAAIYDPSGNNDPDSAYMAYIGPWLPYDGGGTWDGIFTGVARLDAEPSTYTETASAPNNGDVIIPAGLVTGAPGIFWSVDWASANSENPDGIILYKGVWNSTSKDVVWAIDSIFRPNFDLSFDNTAQVTGLNMGFDPTGQYGWICFVGDIQVAGPESFDPVFYSTTDGGSTWSGPTIVDLAGFDNVVNNLVVNGNPMTGFDVDIAVDIYGNPHMAVVIGSEGAGYAISSGPSAGMKLYDITKGSSAKGCEWQAILVDSIANFRGDITSEVSQDNQVQVSRSPDGTKIFIGWVDSNPIQTSDNDLPNLHTRGFDVTTGLATQTINRTGDNGDPFNGGALFPQFATTTLVNGSTYSIPTVIAILNSSGSDEDPTDFVYVTNIEYTNSDFTEDVLAPVISLGGNNPMTIVQGNAYNEPSGNSAMDNVDGNITGSLSINATQVNTNNIGTYSVFYNVSDAEGNAACEVVRTVNVVASPDNTPPVITLVGASTINIDACDFFSDPGATASDNVDGVITQNIVVTSNVVPGTPGTYTIDYDVTDGAGNAATTVTRTVVISDLPPTITLNGANPMNVEVCYSYVEMGAFAFDNCAGALNVTITGTVDTSTTGSYTITYTANDGVNGPTSVTRTVNVTADVTPPVFTLSGSNPMYIYLGDPYVDPKGLAADCVDGDVSANIVANPASINTSVRDTVTVAYSVSDLSNNTATANRTVIVNTEPTADFTSNLIVGGNGKVDFTDKSLHHPSSWLWDFGDNLISTNQNPSHIYAVDGTYNVCLTAKNVYNNPPFSKAASTTCKSVSVVGVGIEENALARAFRIYPNPTSGLLLVEVSDLNFKEFTLTVYNTLGAELSDLGAGEVQGPGKMVVDMSNYPTGVYMLHIRTEQGVVTKKVSLYSNN